MSNADALAKRRLLAGWFSQFTPDRSVRLLSAGEPIDATMLRRLAEAFGLVEELSIYVLLAHIAGENVPVYVGKARTPLERWKGHIAGLGKGQGAYRAWRKLLVESNGAARYELTLLIAPESSIGQPPIPDFPMTVGSVEYQLEGLVSDAYPETLLNREGRRR